MKKIKRFLNNFLGGNVTNKRLNFILLCIVVAVGMIIGFGVKALIADIRDSEKIPEREIKTVTANEKISLNDSSLGEIWLEAIDGMPKNTYNADGFTSDKTFKYYSENGKKASYCGIDVSTFQGKIDWQKVKNAGVDFAIIRIGGRGYTDGAIYEDDKFEQNIKNAKAAGIKVGAYFFSQATTIEEAKEEANFVVEKLKGFSLDYPVAYDWEVIGTSEARTDYVSPQVLTDCARNFCDIISKNGYKPMIYVSKRLGYYKYDLSQLSDIDLWYVEYDYTPSFYYNFAIWQYSESATIDGINGETDVNICFKEY